jgi:hypothetical protein
VDANEKMELLEAAQHELMKHGGLYPGINQLAGPLSLVRASVTEK